ncbi:hypothetical protein SDC9_148136 [bioreactor metagenome]|uniref:Uncharacterized protein n=1 Tax=bioreactor metagenome TaxID=1076179 RepID=A0A645EG12_9ZZZZ
MAVCARPASMDDSLGNALVVEMRDLLAQDEVFQQRRPTPIGTQRILVVGDGNALLRGQRRMELRGLLLQFPTLACGAIRIWFGRGAASGLGRASHERALRGICKMPMVISRSLAFASVNGPMPREAQ